MYQYKKLLHNLNPSDSLAIPYSKSIAFILTGQSSYDHSELTREQRSLLTIFTRFGIKTLETNFPYNNKHILQKVKRPRLILASIKNSGQFFYSVFDSQYGSLIYKHLSPCLYKRKKVFVVAGSLGLQMLAKSLTYFDTKTLKSITVFALGPVTTTQITASHSIEMITIKGKQDYISKTFDKTPADYLVRCGHMDYYQNEEVKRIISHHLEQRYPTIS